MKEIESVAAASLRMTPAVYQILLSLADGERHGYGIMQEVEIRTSGEVRLGPGTLYRSIKHTRKAGLIEATGDPLTGGDDEDRRRFYRITKPGRDVLANEARRLGRLVEQAHSKNVIDGLREA